MIEKQPISIKQLYPEFTEEQLAEAEANLRQFAAVLLKIYEDRQRDSRALDDFRQDM